MTLWFPSKAPSEVPNVESVKFPDESVTPDAERPLSGKKVTVALLTGAPL